MLKVIDLAALITEMNRRAGNAVPEVTFAEVQNHVANGDLHSWLRDNFEGQISDEEFKALMWMAHQVMPEPPD